MKVSFEILIFLKCSYYFMIDDSDSKYLFQPSLVEGPDILPLKSAVL